jgi:hypothetical protein
MNDFQKAQHQKILSCYSQESILESLMDICKADIDFLNQQEQDLIEKGGKRAEIGELRTFGKGRVYIKTATGWEFYGKGKGAVSQNHINKTHEHHAQAGTEHPEVRKQREAEAAAKAAEKAAKAEARAAKKAAAEKEAKKKAKAEAAGTAPAKKAPPKKKAPKVNIA